MIEARSASFPGTLGMLVKIVKNKWRQRRHRDDEFLVIL